MATLLRGMGELVVMSKEQCVLLLVMFSDFTMILDMQHYFMALELMVVIV